MLQLGWKAGTEQYPPDVLLDYAIAAEETGFDSIDVSDHFHPWRNDDVSTSFVWSWLGAVGARTKRIQFGTGVTCPREASSLPWWPSTSTAAGWRRSPRSSAAVFPSARRRATWWARPPAWFVAASNRRPPRSAPTGAS